MKMGIPCSHDLKIMLSNKKQITEEDFDQQWWLVIPQPTIAQDSQMSLPLQSNNIMSNDETLFPDSQQSQSSELVSTETFQQIQNMYV